MSFFFFFASSSIEFVGRLTESFHPISDDDDDDDERYVCYFFRVFVVRSCVMA